MKQDDNVFLNNMSTLHQIALLQSMVAGDYYGHITIANLKKLGDFGIGTFYQLNGELILLNGVVYQAKEDGQITIPDENETVSFSTVSFFKPDFELVFQHINNIDQLFEKLDQFVIKKGKNRFYTVKIEGMFSSIRVRTAAPQKTPYDRLDLILPINQRLYEYEAQKGTLVGLYCPPFVQSLNMPGWHFHFLSDSRTKGGHLLDLKLEQATITFSKIDQFLLHLPPDDFFHQLDLSQNLENVIYNIEKTR